MPLKFYYSPMSTAEVTHAVFAELEHGQPNPLAERVNVNIPEGEAKTAQFLSEVNPNGLVPAIVQDGVTIWESAAITIYLGETFGVNRKVNGISAPLFPEAGARRGEAMKWIVWPNLHLASHTLSLHDGQPPEIKVCSAYLHPFPDASGVLTETRHWKAAQGPPLQSLLMCWMVLLPGGTTCSDQSTRWQIRMYGVL